MQQFFVPQLDWLRLVHAFLCVALGFSLWQSPSQHPLRGRFRTLGLLCLMQAFWFASRLLGPTITICDTPLRTVPAAAFIVTVVAAEWIRRHYRKSPFWTPFVAATSLPVWYGVCPRTLCPLAEALHGVASLLVIIPLVWAFRPLIAPHVPHFNRHRAFLFIACLYCLIRTPISVMALMGLLDATLASPAGKLLVTLLLLPTLALLLLTQCRRGRAAPWSAATSDSLPYGQYLTPRAGVALLTLFACGWWWTNASDHHAQQEMRRQALYQGEIVAGALCPEQVRHLLDSSTRSQSSTKLNSAFQRILARDRRGMSSIYILGQRNGKAIFLADSRQPWITEPTATPGAEHEDASPELMGIFTTGKAIVEGPLPDRWGTWVSALIPLPVAHEAGNYVILGMDIAAASWNDEITAARFPPTAITGLAALGLLGYSLHHASLRLRDARLAISEERFTHALNATRDGIWDWNLRTGEIYLSPQWCQSLGLCPSDVIPTVDFWKDRVHPEDFLRCQQALQDLIAGKTPICQIENRLRTQDGSYRANLLRCTVVERDSSGIATRIVGIDSDITLQKRSEAVLKQQNRFLQSLMDAIPQPVFCKDRNGVYIACNKAFERRYGRTAADIIGKTIFDLGSPTAAIHHQRDQELFNADHAACPPCQVYESTDSLFQEPLRTLLITKATYTDADGHVIGLVGTTTDISEQKRIQRELQSQREMLQTIINTAPLRIYWKDRDGRYLGCNNMHASAAGLPSPDAIKGLTDADLSWSDACELIRDDDLEIITAGEGRYQFLERQDRTVGSSIWLQTSKVPLRDEEGTIVGLLGISQDVTEQVRNQNTLAHSEARHRLLLESLSDGLVVFTIGPDGRPGRFVEANPAACDALGYSLSELLKLTPANIEFAGPQPDFAKILRELKGGRRVLYEYVHTNRAGRDAPIEVHAHNFDLDGKPAVLCIVRDVSDRIRQQQFVKAIMRTVQAGVVVTEQSSGLIVNANAAAAAILQRVPMELPGTPWRQYLSDHAAIASDDHVTHDCVLTDSRGNSVDVRLAQAPVAVGDQHYHVHSFVDITDIQRLLANNRRLLREQEINITLAAQILQLVNRRPPRHVPLDDAVALFIEQVSIPCKAAGGDHCLVRTFTPSDHASAGSHTVVSIMDQSGHEVNCILRSIITDLIHHSLLAASPDDPLEVRLALLNEQLCSPGLFGDDDFLTAAILDIDHATKTLSYACCGHPPILLIRDQKVQLLPEPRSPGRNMPLASLPDATFTVGHCQLQEGDRIILHTDGLTEMPIACGKPKISVQELAAMVEQLLSTDPTVPVSRIVQHLLTTFSQACDVQLIPGRPSTASDDVTLVGLEIEPLGHADERVLYPSSDQDVADAIVDLHQTILQASPTLAPLSTRLRLVLEEALINAWRHGNQKDPQQPITVRWRFRNDLSVEIVDCGQGFNAERIHDPRIPVQRGEPGGRGVFLIKGTSDSARWKDSGRHLTTHFAMPLHPDERRRCSPGSLPVQWW